MWNKVTNEYGSKCKEGDNWIRERGLIFIPRIYNRLLIVIHTCVRNRKINLYFPNSQIPPFSFDIGSYNNTNDTLNFQIREDEQRILWELNHFDDFSINE
jgi:hypothetical protein